MTHRPEPQIPDHIVAYLIAKYEASAQVALDAKELNAATMYRLRQNVSRGSLVITSDRISQESAVWKDGNW